MSRNVNFFVTPRKTLTIFNEPKPLHKCVFCKEKHPIEYLKVHIANHLVRGQFTCNKCDRVFRKLHYLNIHLTLKHSEGMPYQCKRRDKQFSKKYNYESHLLTHKRQPNELPHKCKVCGKTFANRIYLHRHSFQHTGRKSFWSHYMIKKCVKCLKTFPTAEDFMLHTIAKCQRVEPSKPSSDVSKPSSDVSQPPSDVSKPSSDVSNPSSDGLTLWKCDKCPKTYSKLGSFKVHKYNAHNAKKICELCGAKVSFMKVHMKTHEQEPIECEICQKKLASKVTLIKHLLIHTDERPYKCKYCDKRFRAINSRIIHQRVHEGVKRHICPICSKGFLEKAYMQKHLKTVHKVDYPVAAIL